jgi:hypothetical protein
LRPRHHAKAAKERTKIMPVRRLTQQEVREWLGSGIVLSGIRLPKRLPQLSPDSEKATETGQPQIDQADPGNVNDHLEGG